LSDARASQEARACCFQESGAPMVVPTLAVETVMVWALAAELEP